MTVFAGASHNTSWATLLKTSDELVESMHQHVFKRMKGYNVKYIQSQKHGEMLHKLVRRINLYNLIVA